MLDSADYRRIYQHAYLPEHLPDYVEAVSRAKPYLHDEFLCFLLKKHLIFIGYPLVNPTADPAPIYDSVCELYRPDTVAVIASEIWLPPGTFEEHPPDSFYRLNLPMKSLGASLAYMIRRAEKELHVNTGKYGKEHRRLVKAFVAAHKLTPEQKYIYKNIHRYVKKSKSAFLIEARKGTRLAAFTIADMGSAEYAFYMFNFRSTKDKIPGASDLLFYEMVKMSQSEGKKAINLGLGIHPGIRHFKEKWGGIPFLAYSSALVHRKPVDIGKLAHKL